MKKLYVKRHVPMYEPWYRRSWLWWYVAYGESQPFKRFGHDGWICLRFNWFKRFWSCERDGCQPQCSR